MVFAKGLKGQPRPGMKAATGLTSLVFAAVRGPKQLIILVLEKLGLGFRV